MVVPCHPSINMLNTYRSNGESQAIITIEDMHACPTKEERYIDHDHLNPIQGDDDHA
jgi:hypothetical protein